MADTYKLVVAEKLIGRPHKSLADAQAAGAQAIPDGQPVRVERWGVEDGTSGPIRVWGWDPDMLEWLESAET